MQETVRSSQSSSEHRVRGGADKLDGGDKFFSRLLARGIREDIEMQSRKHNENVHAERTRLVNVLFGAEAKCSSRLVAYLDYIEEQLQVAGRQRLAPLLKLAGHADNILLEDMLCMVTEIASVVRHDNNDGRSTDSVLQALMQHYKASESSVDNAAREKCWQSICDVLCWLTTLVEPGATEPKEVMKLPAASTGWPGRRPFTSLMLSYGTFLPEVNDVKAVSTHSAAGLTSQIYVSRINYWSLRTIGKVRLQWTNSLSAHLFFDHSTRTLYMYRLPGLCVANLETANTVPLFNSILAGFYSHVRPNHDYLGQLQREVLLSYRLIFGQSKASRKVFFGREKSRAALSTTLDPSLNILCGQRKTKNTTFSRRLWLETLQDLDGSLLEQDVYDAELDFRLLGNRLLALQSFNSRQQPGRIRDLWRDRRDPLQWYTFWLVLVVGGLSLVISILQCALSAAQLAQVSN